MADTKITALTAITTVDPANDVLPIVDVSDTSMAASGTTKKITTNQLLGASGTATLASATISGALTVQGNGPHRFGTSNYSQFDQSSLQFVGSRSTPGTLSIYGNTNRLIFQADTGGYLFQNAANTLTLLSIANDATQVTLNSTGLGVGITPSAKLHVEGGGAQARFSIASASDARHEYYRNGIREGLIYWDANLVGLYATQSAGEVVIASSNTIRARVKASGQVRFVPLASDPAGAEAGDVYYNSTSNKLKCYNGTTWNDLF